MPRKTDSMKLGSHFLDKRTRLLPCQKERIYDMINKEGHSQRAVARCFNVSRRTIQFIADPQKLQKNQKRRAERGGWEQYYDKDKHAAYTKKHRTHKKDTLK